MTNDNTNSTIHLLKECISRIEDGTITTQKQDALEQLLRFCLESDISEGDYRPEGGMTKEYRPEGGMTKEYIKYLFTGWLFYNLGENDKPLEDKCVSNTPMNYTFAISFQVNRPDNEELVRIMQAVHVDKVDFLQDSECSVCKTLFEFVAFNNDGEMLCRECYAKDTKHYSSDGSHILDYDDVSHMRITRVILTRNNDDMVINDTEKIMTLTEFYQLCDTLAQSDDPPIKNL